MESIYLTPLNPSAYTSDVRISRKNSTGFTLIELLVVIAILALLLLFAFTQAPIFLARANDSRRKSDLQALKIAIEQYYADKKCYPLATDISACESTNSVLSPYLPKIPCDPVTRSAYIYLPDGCKSFRLYTTLVDTKDTDILKLGCQNGCGLDVDGNGTGDNNYYVSSNNVPADISFRYAECGGGGGMGRCAFGQTGCCSPSGYICDVSQLYCVKR